MIQLCIPRTSRGLCIENIVDSDNPRISWANASKDIILKSLGLAPSILLWTRSQGVGGQWPCDYITI